MMDMLRQVTPRWRWLALVLLAVLLPFELKTPIASLGPIVITDVELLLYILILWWIVCLFRARRIHWTLVHSAVLAWLIVQFSAAILAPVERDAAIKFALRSAGGAAVFFITAEWIRAESGAARVMSAIVIGAAISAAAGLLEVPSTAIQAALLIFKTQATLVGGTVRAGGPFQYANTAAMYWEAALPITLAVGVWWSAKLVKRRWLVWALAVSFILIEAVIWSASRAALVSMAMTLGIMIVSDRMSTSHSALARPAGISLIGLGLLVGVQLMINPIFTVRLRSESDDSWFRATIQPAQTKLIATTNAVFTTIVSVTNTSVQIWPANGIRSVRVSYHWIQPGSRRVLILDGERTPLPRDLAPGESAAVSAFVKVPPMTGTFLLQWDLVQEDVTWFSERGSEISDVSVQVLPARQHQTVEMAAGRGLLRNTSSPARAELWRAGVRMWLNYPWLGAGPDSFRHVYGQYLSQAAFDDRITANSWYVELLATTGAVGLIGWMLIPVALLVVARRQWGWLSRRERMLCIGLAMALSAFFLHGVVDYFMEFTPIYGLFWLITGLLVGVLTGIQDVEVVGLSDRV